MFCDEMVITIVFHGEYDAVTIKVLSGGYHHLFKSSMMYRENFILPAGYLT